VSRRHVARLLAAGKRAGRLWLFDKPVPSGPENQAQFGAGRRFDRVQGLGAQIQAFGGGTFGKQDFVAAHKNVVIGYSVCNRCDIYSFDRGQVFGGDQNLGFAIHPFGDFRANHQAMVARDHKVAFGQAGSKRPFCNPDRGKRGIVTHFFSRTMARPYPADWLRAVVFGNQQVAGAQMFDAAWPVGGFERCAAGKADIRGAGCRGGIIIENTRTIGGTLDREPVVVVTEIFPQPDTRRSGRKTGIRRGGVVQRIAVEGGLNIFVVGRIIDDDIVTAVINQGRTAPCIKE